LVGFDIDVVTEVAKRIGKTIEFKDMNFEALLPQVQLGAIEVIAAGMTPTPEREKIVSFTKPYIIGDPLVIVTLADSDTKDLEDLKKGRRVVVNQGYTADFYMSKIEGPELIRLETPAEAFLSLQQGRADAYVTAKNTLAPFFKKRDAEGFERKIIPGTDESTALIVSKKYPELLREIQGALHQMERDGTMTTLKKKWDINA
jgi:polar amino acid transport system substrate-binding protein